MKFRLVLVLAMTLFASGVLALPHVLSDSPAPAAGVTQVRFVAAPQAVVPSTRLTRTPRPQQHRASPRPAPHLTAAACRAGRVALTFDDGPLPTVTPRLTALLRKRHVPATFFMVGSRVDAYPELVRMVARRGFTIGNHTYAHANLTEESPADARSGLVATRRAFARAKVRPTDLMRPPYGAIDSSVRSIVHALGLVPVLWDVDSRDWTGLSSRAIAHGVISQVQARGRAGSVVLQHDGVENSPATLAALPHEITALRRAGYCFTALDATGEPSRP